MPPMGAKQAHSLSQLGGEDYKRCRVLGKGSFGKVYAVEHCTTGIFRVVKEMHKGTIITQNMVAMIKKERELLSELKGCPFVVKCFASAQDENFLYLLLEFCSGGELEFHFRAQHTFSEEIIRSYLTQIGVALEYMHTKYNVVHRDIKPGNVLVDDQGFCSIIDFNMATKCDENLYVPNPQHHIVGTLLYMAPEMLSGKDHTNKVDYWSLGIMAYEFAHGKKPFSVGKGEGTDKKKMLHAIKHTKLFACISTTLSNEFIDLLFGLLQIDPKDRFGAEQFKSHKFFSAVDWDAVLEKKKLLYLLYLEKIE